MAISTNGTVLARVAGALYNTQMSNATYSEVKTLDPASLVDALYARDFSTATDAAVATTLVTNLGLTSVTGLVNWVAAQLTAAGSHKGAKIVDLLNGFAQMTADATYGAYATAFNATVDAALVLSQTTGNAGGTFTAAGVPVNATFALTTGVDSFTGGAGNDTFTATDATLTTLDAIDGGAGVNTLTFTDTHSGGASVLPVAISLKNVQTMNVISAGKVGADTTHRLDVSGLTSVTTLNVTRSYDDNFINAGAGQSVNVSGGSDGKAVDVVATTGAVNVTALGAVTVAGGSTQTASAKGGVNLTGATGAVSATDSAQGAANAVIKDGTSNTLTTTVALAATTNDAANHATNSKVTIGAASHLPTGAVSVVENITGLKSANETAGDITVNGGSTVTVTQAATQAIATQSTTAGATTTNYTATQAAVAVNGSTATTAVTVNQSATVSKVDSVTAKAGVAEVDTFAFASAGLANSSSVTVGGLTFTNNSGATITQAQVAAAFANLVSGAITGKSTLGVYSGSFATGWTTGAVTATKTIIATQTTPATTTTPGTPTLTADGTVATVTDTDGVAAVAAVAGVGGIVNGAVAVADYGYGDATKADSITSVTLNGYATSSTVQSDALTTLSLANAKDAAVSVSNNTATALNLTVNNLTATTAGSNSTLTIDAGTAVYKTLAVTATGANSTVNVTGAAVETLTVSGDKSLNLTGSTFTNLKTVTISGSAGVTAASAFTGSAVTDVNASGTSGSVSASIDSSKATYEGSTGADTITLTSTTVSKAVALGAGNDTLNLASGTTSLTATVDGGDGTDTLGMAAADAATASANNLFMGKFSNFEKLSLGQVAASTSNSVDLSNMNGLSYVVSAGTVAATTLSATAAKTDGGGAAESTAFTFTGSLYAGQSYTLDGKTVTASATLTAANVADALTGGTVSGATVSGSFAVPSGWTAVTGTKSSNVLTLTNSVTGNVNDFTSVGSGSTAGALTLTKMANNGTLELTAAGGATVTMTDATGTSDSFSIVTKVNASDISFGTASVAGVETVNITATDTTPTDTSGNATISKATLTLSDSAAKTVVISGNSDLDLTAAGSALTAVNASALTGKLTFSSAVDNAVVTGGSAADVLTATGNGQTLNGGAGADTLVVTGNLTVLTGGAGNDVFDVSDATSNVNNYATITDLAAGDAIKFNSNSTGFAAAKVTLADTAIFQDYANTAIANSAQYAVSWFQYNGNTYVVQDVSNSTTTFTNGTDLIVKITGLVDLSTATFNTTTDSLYV